jgi:hypothetical protein
MSIQPVSMSSSSSNVNFDLYRLENQLKNVEDKVEEMNENKDVSKAADTTETKTADLLKLQMQIEKLEAQIARKQEETADKAEKLSNLSDSGQASNSKTDEDEKKDSTSDPTETKKNNSNFVESIVDIKV